MACEIWYPLAKRISCIAVDASRPEGFWSIVFCVRPPIKTLLSDAASRLVIPLASDDGLPILIVQLIDQDLCVLQIGGIEAFGEPVVDFGEHRARLIAAIGVAQQSCEAGCRS